jgi:hypothetical protein
MKAVLNRSTLRLLDIVSLTLTFLFLVGVLVPSIYQHLPQSLQLTIGAALIAVGIVHLCVSRQTR